MMDTPLAQPAARSGAYQPLDPRHIAHVRVIAGVFTAVFGFVFMLGALIVILAVDSFGPGRALLVVLAALVLTAAVGLPGWLWPPVAHRHASYRIDDGGIEIRRGVWWRRAIHIPRSRIQHTDVSQGPIERNFGLATLHVFTAGTDHAEVTLGGLAHDTAVAIRDRLLTGAGDDVV